MNFTTLFSGNGSQITTWNYKATGSRQLLLVSGSGCSTVANSLITMNIMVNGTVAGSIKVWANPANQHMAYISGAIPLALAPNSKNTITLARGSDNTYLDYNDYYNVTIIDQ